MNLKKIKLTGKSRLILTWDDDSVSGISTVDLRRYCPCATCMEERDSQSDSFFAVFTRDQQTILKIDMVGSYAISVTWKDGHSSGIYDFLFLYRLSNRENKINAPS